MNKKYTINKIALALSVAFALPTFAEEAKTESAAEEDKKLEVILVTAQKRVQNVKEVPISISAMNQEKLLEANITNSVELSSYISNFDVSQSGQGYNVIMRGLGSGPNQGFEQTVGTFVDGIYRGRGHLMRSAFLDLERVEVLRGPQSALFGKNTTAGALNLTNAKPTNDLQGYVNLNYDFNFDSTTLETAVSNSLSDNVQGRIALKYVDDSGHIENTLSGKDEVAHETLVGRLTLAWQPSSDVNVLLSAQHDKDDFNGYAATQAFVEPAIAASGAPILDALQDYVLDDKNAKSNPALGEEDKGTFEADHLTLNVEYDMGDHVLTSTTGYQSYKLIQSNDGDSSPLPLVYRTLGDERYDQTSQEFRLTSAFDGDFQYIAGVYYQTSNMEYVEHYTVYPLSIDGQRKLISDSDSAAIFAQFDYNISEQWQATLGLRYSQEDKDGYRKLTVVDPATGTPIVDMPVVTAPAIAANFPNGLPGPVYASAVLAGLNIVDHEVEKSRTEKNFTPALNIKYKMEDAMIYGSISTGNKAGGFDARASTPDDFEFEDEKVVSTELGTKFTLDDGLADINIALFNMKFDNLQTSVYDGNTSFFVKNAGKATSRGLEIDGRWAFTDNWLMSGSLGLLDFTWDEFKGAKCFSSVALTSDNVDETGASCDYSGETNAFAPKVSGSVNFEYYTEIGNSYEFKASLDLIHKSDFYTNADLNPWTKQEAYTKVNARLALMDIGGSWQVALVGKNLTNKTTLNFSTDLPLLGKGFYVGFTDPGRSVSLQVSYNFDS